MRKVVSAAPLQALVAARLTGFNAVAGPSRDVKAIGKPVHKAADMAQ
ncbi:MAG: hypothetical protein KGL42_11590 [Betaproteobacteria bacterium]|nr:hypothetical protein [Betaproteobacteria bacterium]